MDYHHISMLIVDFLIFLKKYRNTPIHHFGKQLQPDNSIKCGLYVIMFIHYVSHFGLKLFTSFFNTVDLLKKKKKNII